MISADVVLVLGLMVIYESGFQTKSIFNREFLRDSGKNPSQRRADKN
jgi:AraC-like DNA-binding protein